MKIESALYFNLFQSFHHSCWHLPSICVDHTSSRPRWHVRPASGIVLHAFIALQPGNEGSGSDQSWLCQTTREISSPTSPTSDRRMSFTDHHFLHMTIGGDSAD
jgi:hypothetical protein